MLTSETDFLEEVDFPSVLLGNEVLPCVVRVPLQLEAALVVVVDGEPAAGGGRATSVKLKKEREI